MVRQKNTQQLCVNQNLIKVIGAVIYSTVRIERSDIMKVYNVLLIGRNYERDVIILVGHTSNN